MMSLMLARTNPLSRMLRGSRKFGGMVMEALNPAGPPDVRPIAPADSSMLREVRAAIDGRPVTLSAPLMDCRLGPRDGRVLLPNEFRERADALDDSLWMFIDEMSPKRLEKFPLLIPLGTLAGASDCRLLAVFDRESRCLPLCLCELLFIARGIMAQL